MWILWLIIGLVLGTLTRYIPINKKSNYLRRGIITKQFAITSLGVKTGDLECQLEIGELERTDKKSKIKIINYIPNGTQHSSATDESNVRKLVDNSWIESSEVEWINDSLLYQRNEKLNKILN